MSQHLTHPSPEPERTRYPSAPQSRLNISRMWPSRIITVRPVLRSQIRPMLSKPPLARSEPSGLKLTANTCREWPSCRGQVFSGRMKLHTTDAITPLAKLTESGDTLEVDNVAPGYHATPPTIPFNPTAPVSSGYDLAVWREASDADRSFSCDLRAEQLKTLQPFFNLLAVLDMGS
ncbi:hypothetical protein KCU88_g391, partial [Aureobasidium melanogenum]